MLRVSDFDFDLPEELIAQSPVEPRDSSRLLVVEPNTPTLRHARFADLPEYLSAGDLLVVNETRVTARRLLGVKPTGGAVEALLLREVAPGCYLSLASPGRRLKVGARVKFDNDLWASVTSVEGAARTFEFDDKRDLSARLAGVGKVPLPPYIHSALSDESRYQTVFARVGGSAAAPTAGLHFTEQLIKRLKAKGVDFASVRLNVGLDTFKPMTGESLDDHKMHGETCAMGAEAVEALTRCKGRVVAVGTTSARTIESFYNEFGGPCVGELDTHLFISPGYTFRGIHGMITNFHMPRTTMLVMISALAGRNLVLRAYEEAIEERYRFLSFGDAMMILPGKNPCPNVLS